MTNDYKSPLCVRAHTLTLLKQQMIKIHTIIHYVTICNIKSISTLFTQKTFHFSHAPTFDLFENERKKKCSHFLTEIAQKEFLRNKKKMLKRNVSSKQCTKTHTFIVHSVLFNAYDFRNLCRWLLARMFLIHFDSKEFHITFKLQIKNKSTHSSLCCELAMFGLNLIGYFTWFFMINFRTSRLDK